MSSLFAVILDGTPQLEFDREKAVPRGQLAYLDDMDARMDRGIELEGGPIERPDDAEKARFVARNLAQALLSGNEKLAAAMCTWLAVRRPALQQLKITTGEFGLTLDLDHDTPYEKPRPAEQPIVFNPPRHDS